MLVTDAVQEYEFATGHLSPTSRRWNHQKLDAFARWLGEHDVTQLDAVDVPVVRRFFDALRTQRNPRSGQPLSTYTQRGYFAIVRIFLTWCVREDLLPDRFGKRLAPPKVEQKVIQTFTPSEVATLFAACDQGSTPTMVARDKAILAVLLDTGVRASELCGLTLDRCYLTTTSAWILVTGKGKKEREVGLGKEARMLLHRYLVRYRHAPESERHVFLSRTGRPMTVFQVDELLYRLRDRAGRQHFGTVRVSAHTCRHTFAVRFMEHGGDIYTLSHLLGHTAIATTQIYLRDFKQREARKQTFSVLDDMVVQRSTR